MTLREEILKKLAKEKRWQKGVNDCMGLFSYSSIERAVDLALTAAEAEVLKILERRIELFRMAVEFPNGKSKSKAILIELESFKKHLIFKSKQNVGVKQK